MKRLLHYWQALRYSLWFVPALVVAGAVGLAIASIAADGVIDAGDLPDWPRLFTGSADGARGTLEVIAAAMISIAALTFSITVLVLSSAAAQYTPRVIRSFMGSTVTKLVLGVFVGIYVYCLIVLRTVSSSDPEFVPAVGVTLGLLLALVGVGFLIAFIHHMASSIQVSTLVSDIGRETISAVERLYPEWHQDEGEQEEEQGGGQGNEQGDEQNRAQPAAMRPPASGAWQAIPSPRTGYIQSVDYAGLACWAHDHGRLLRMEKTVGEFVLEGQLLLAAEPGGAQVDQLGDACRYFAIGTHRTVEQDIGVGITQLSDMAVRAMSPAINDANTAAACMDYLTAILARLARRSLEPHSGVWEKRRALIVRGPSFSDFLRHAFEPVRLHANGNFAIYEHMLHALHALVPCATVPGYRAALQREAALVHAYATANLQHSDQLARIEQAWQAFGSACSAAPC